MKTSPLVAILSATAVAFGLAFLGRDSHSVQPAEAAKQEQRLYTCGMHPQVIQDHPGSCPICGMQLAPLEFSGGRKPGGERKVKYYWDPMLNPPYISDKPGKSPMGMDLIPVYEDEVAGGMAVSIDPVIVQNMGVRTAQVVEAPLRRQIRAAGYLTEPEPGHFDVNLRVSGWIEKLHADTEGMHVPKGMPLFELYSPELHVAIEELIAARKARGARPAAGGVVDRTADLVYEAARRKLDLYGLQPAQIDEFARLERAPRTVTFYSPMEAHLTEKTAYAGAAVKAGERVLRLADRSIMWVDAQIFEQDLAFVREGQPAEVEIDALPGRKLGGEVIFLHPHLDPLTRTGRARVSVVNEAMVLRQGMYATLTFDVELSPRALQVPREAVIDTGVRQIVFVALGQGHFEPRKVRMGAGGNDGMVQVLTGLAPGERVVTSGQFLLDAESRLQEAIQKHLAERKE